MVAQELKSDTVYMGILAKKTADLELHKELISSMSAGDCTTHFTKLEGWSSQLQDNLSDRLRELQDVNARFMRTVRGNPAFKASN